MAKTKTAKLIDLIAREAERAYRRGFQQGKVIGPHIDDMALVKWRYGRSLAKAPPPDHWRPIPGLDTARARLELECPTIEREVQAILERAKP